MPYLSGGQWVNQIECNMLVECNCTIINLVFYPDALWYEPKYVKFLYLDVHGLWNSEKLINDTSMAYCKTTVTPLLTHWSYCSLALSHRHIPVAWCWNPQKWIPSHRNSLLLYLLQKNISSKWIYFYFCLLMNVKSPNFLDIFHKLRPSSLKGKVNKVGEPLEFCFCNVELHTILQFSYAESFHAGVQKNRLSLDVTWDRSSDLMPTGDN